MLLFREGENENTKVRMMWIPYIARTTLFWGTKPSPPNIYFRKAHQRVNNFEVSGSTCIDLPIKHFSTNIDLYSAFFSLNLLKESQKDLHDNLL